MTGEDEQIEVDSARDEAIVRAHAWAIRMWDERKISAEFTSADEADLVAMLLGFLDLYKDSFAPSDGAKTNACVNEPRFDALWKMRKDAIDIMAECGHIDGAHHKMWVIDQAMRALLGEEYNDFRWAYEKEIGIVWDEGVAP